MRVREILQRSRRTLMESATRQRLEGPTRQLLERSRATVAQIVGTSPVKDTGAQDVLAGVCSSVALRDLNLVDSLLEQLERMEANEDDPDTLAQLYKLDHLATRLRRNAENLRVLAGRDAGRGRDETSSLVDVIRAGMSAIEHYARVDLGKVASLGVVGLAGDDVGRILAELLDNATTHSPPSSQVVVSAHLTEQGSVMIRIEDAGIGMPPARIASLNERLDTAPVLDRNAVRHMGLAVVRRLASRHGIRVWMARRSPHGTTASVLLPPALVHEPATPRQPSAGGDTSATSREQLKRPVRPRPAPLPTPEPEPPAPEQDTVDSSTKNPAAESGHADYSSMTRNGLPRRIPKSLKETAVAWPVAEPAESTEQSQRAGHEQLVEDLGAFAEGEQAAHEDQARAHANKAEEGRDW